MTAAPPTPARLRDSSGARVSLARLIFFRFCFFFILNLLVSGPSSSRRARSGAGVGDGGDLAADAGVLDAANPVALLALDRGADDPFEIPGLQRRQGLLGQAHLLLLTLLLFHGSN